jgi:heptosyltransferase-2/heptosyltransferase-3
MPLIARPLRPTVIRFGRFGDMVMLTALTAALHQRYGAPCQVVGAGPWNADIFRAHPDVERVWSLPRHLPIALNLTAPHVLAALLRAPRGPVYVCEPHARQLVRARRLLKYGGIDSSRCLFITDVPLRENEHCIDRLLRFAEQTPAALGDRAIAPAAGQRWSPRLQVLDEERRARDAWLRANGWYGRDLVLIQAGNFRSMSGHQATAERRAADDKSWPAERWQKLFALIHAHSPGALIVLCGASSEAPMLRSLRDEVTLDCVVVADPPLRQLFALCESAHSMISVDTGPAHAAAALGVPLVVLYGAESPAYWLPRGPAGTAVVGLGGPPHSTRVDQLEVEGVFAAWRSLPPRGQAAGVAAANNEPAPGSPCAQCS